MKKPRHEQVRAIIEAHPQLPVKELVQKARDKGLVVTYSAVYQQHRKMAPSLAKRAHVLDEIKRLATPPQYRRRVKRSSSPPVIEKPAAAAVLTLAELEAQLSELENTRAQLLERIQAARLRELVEQDPERIRTALALLADQEAAAANGEQRGGRMVDLGELLEQQKSS